MKLYPIEEAMSHEILENAEHLEEHTDGRALLARQPDALDLGRANIQAFGCKLSIPVRGRPDVRHPGHAHVLPIVERGDLVSAIPA